MISLFSPEDVPASCTLPSQERPFRLAEFTGLFRQSLTGVTRIAPAHVRLHLAPGSFDHAQDLAARETLCCSFFDFEVREESDEVTIDVRVPAAHVAVLSALVSLANTAGDSDPGLLGTGSAPDAP